MEEWIKCPISFGESKPLFGYLKVLFVITHVPTLNQSKLLNTPSMLVLIVKLVWNINLVLTLMMCPYFLPRHVIAGWPHRRRDQNERNDSFILWEKMRKLQYSSSSPSLTQTSIKHQHTQQNNNKILNFGSKHSKSVVYISFIFKTIN